MRERVSRNERRKEKQNILPGDIMTFSREVFASDSSLVLVLPKPEFTAPSKRIDSNNTNLAADLGLIKQRETASYFRYWSNYRSLTQIPTSTTFTEWRLRNPPRGLYLLAPLFHQQSLPLRTTKTCARYIDCFNMTPVRTFNAFNSKSKSPLNLSRTLHDQLGVRLTRSILLLLPNVSSSPVSQYFASWKTDIV